jgi:hypothetical protein
LLEIVEAKIVLSAVRKMAKRPPPVRAKPSEMVLCSR